MGKTILNKIKVTPLKIKKISSGDVMRVLQKKELKKWSFGEAYFSKINFKKIKAWKYHLKMTLNLAVPFGRVKFVFYSQKENCFRIIEIGERKYLGKGLAKEAIIAASIWLYKKKKIKFIFIKICFSKTPFFQIFFL